MVTAGQRTIRRGPIVQFRVIGDPLDATAPRCAAMPRQIVASAFIQRRTKRHPTASCSLCRSLASASGQHDAWLPATRSLLLRLLLQFACPGCRELAALGRSAPDYRSKDSKHPEDASKVREACHRSRETAFGAQNL